MTYTFCNRFLPEHGDRTVDQMIQAARSGKQNIIEGTEDGETSTEMHIKLLNVARSSLQELREDYRDYLLTRHLSIWDSNHHRYAAMQEFCKHHNKKEEYQPFFQKWDDEEMANIALTLCYQTDAMLNKALLKMEKEFVEEGGMKERMYAARTGYRQQEEEENKRLTEDLNKLRQEVERLRNILKDNGIDYLL